MNKIDKSNQRTLKKIYKYIQNQDFTKLQKFIVKESNKNVKKRNKKHKIKEFIRKNLTSKYRKIKDLKIFYDKNNWQQYYTYKNIEKIDQVNKKDIDKWNIEELKEKYLLLQDVCLKAGDLLIKYQRQLKLSDKVIDKRNEEIVEVAKNNIEKRKIIDLMAEQLAGLTIFDNDIESALILGDKEEVKKYYERKVANEEK